MAEHRAALHEKLVAEESEGLRKLNIGRDKLLAHLWYLATLPPEVTRGNINGQIKATAMFASFGGLIPQASAAHPEQPSVKADIYESEWHREQREKDANQQSNPAVAQQEEERALPSAEPVPAAAPDARNSGLDKGQNSVLNSIRDSIPDSIQTQSWTTALKPPLPPALSLNRPEPPAPASPPLRNWHRPVLHRLFPTPRLVPTSVSPSPSTRPAFATVADPLVQNRKHARHHPWTLQKVLKTSNFMQIYEKTTRLRRWGNS